MQVHDLTLMLSLWIASLTGATLLFVISKMTQTITGTRVWSLAMLLLSFAYLSQLSMQSLDVQWRVLTFNTFLILGHSAWLIGTWQFVERTPSKQKIAWLILPVLLISWLTATVFPERELRITLIGIWLIAVRCHYAWVLYKHARQDRNEFLAARIAIGIVCLEVFFSIMYTLQGALGNLPQIGEAFNWVAGYTWVAALLGILAGAPILLLLSAGRFVKALEFAANHDLLTGLLNRRGLARQLNELLPLSKRKCDSLTVMMIDLDHFKRVNDLYGHQSGDRAIVCIADVLKTHFRSADLLARWGGEEFCLVLFDMQPDMAATCANKLQNAFAQQSLQLGLGDTPLTISIGIACSREISLPGFETTQNQADKALYDAKHAGRNCVKVASMALSLLEETP
ncbi:MULTISPECIES: GGDEF domain-containing protein [Pseudoalteromonas]|uniref:diguanylate cyclase n=1 Tax=Pseudoalteromonas rubra TaxID=43658 RepID=A0A5S3UW07_9GAMM|nr:MULTISPECIES: GGDEF domain-containing protein [Pseudoalteromonas]MCG7561034.1 GGDEF domain-containing protein [Pseudoalteromonas sp. McH1-42]QPB85815.1 diguanylate cyclase [Pseudoalteromonas rubra]